MFRATGGDSAWFEPANNCGRGFCRWQFLRMNEAREEPYTDDRAPVETLIDQMIFDEARKETGG